MNEKNINEIINRFLSGNASEEEIRQLMNWLKESKNNRLTYFNLKRIWINTFQNNNDEEFLEQSLSRLKLRTTLKPKPRIKQGSTYSFLNTKKISVAASFIILIGISSFLGIQLTNMSVYRNKVNEIYVPMGSISSVSLPDGSKVWLNADSKLTYTSEFTRKKREVYLSGEAFFDIKHINNSSFNVNTKDINVTVLGTQFNLKSYDDEDVTETTLITGKLEVNFINDTHVQKQLLMDNNQRMIYSKSKTISESLTESGDSERSRENLVDELISEPHLQLIQINNTDLYTSWKDGRLVFKSESLQHLARKLERYYNITISFEDESIKALRYSGTIEDVTLEELLRAISIDSNISFTVDKDKVLLRK